jgi:hypothetical protein
MEKAVGHSFAPFILRRGKPGNGHDDGHKRAEKDLEHANPRETWNIVNKHC